MRGSATAKKISTCESDQPTTSNSPSSRAQNTSTTDLDLAAVIDAWADLPTPVKAAIGAMIQSINEG